MKKPACPLDEHNFRGCLTFVDGRLTYYENPSLENDFYEKLTSREDWVPYSEATNIKEKDVTRRKSSNPDGYRRSNERLDFYVTKPEFAEAYWAIERLGSRQGSGQVTEVVIFGSLRVVLLATAEFGKRTEITPGTGSAEL